MGQGQYYAVCRVEDIPVGERLFLEINGIPVVIFNIQSDLFAIKDVCTHDNGPVGEGDLEEYKITCPRHGAGFDVRNGKVLSPPAFEDGQIYPIKVEGGEVKIRLG